MTHFIEKTNPQIPQNAAVAHQQQDAGTLDYSPNADDHLPDGDLPHYFISAEQALGWSTELLRLRRAPKISSIYREMISDNPQELTPQQQDFTGERPHLPQDADDRLNLALEVYKHFHALPDDDQKYAMALRFWGDWQAETRLRQALRQQEQLKRQGVRLRLSYRYSYRQVGTVLGVDHKVARKRVLRGLEALETALQQARLVPLRDGGMI